MNNDGYNSSIVSPTIGFCISNNGCLFIANDTIKGFKIEQDMRNAEYDLVMITSTTRYFIYHRKMSDISFDKFKEISTKIINKVLEHLRYNITSNVKVDDIIYEVTSDG